MFWLVDWLDCILIYLVINYRLSYNSRHDSEILDRTTTNGLQQIFYSFVKFYESDQAMMIGWRKGKPSLVSYL